MASSFVQALRQKVDALIVQPTLPRQRAVELTLKHRLPAVSGNRARLRSGVAKEALKLRAERVERSFAHTLDRGGLRRTHLRGRANVQKRYLIHVAGFNLGLVMRLALGAGTPKELAARGGFLFWLIDSTTGLVVLIILLPQDPCQPRIDWHEPSDRKTDLTTPEARTTPSSTGC